MTNVIAQNRLLSGLLAGVETHARATARTVKARHGRDLRRLLLRELARPGIIRRYWADKTWLDEAEAHRKLRARERRKAGHWSFDLNRLAHHREMTAACLWMHWYERTMARVDDLTCDEADRVMADLRAFIEQAKADGVADDLLKRPRRDWLTIYERWASFKFDDVPAVHPQFQEAAE